MLTDLVVTGKCGLRYVHIVSSSLIRTTVKWFRIMNKINNQFSINAEILTQNGWNTMDGTAFVCAESCDPIHLVDLR